MSKNPRHTLTRQWFGSLVFDHRIARYLPFDHTLTEALIASEDRSIVEVMGPVGDDDRIDAFIRHFYAEGLFTHALKFDGRVQSTPSLSRALTGPLSVHLEVVAKCNLTCTHCFAGELPRKADPLTLPELGVLFAELARMGTFRLSLTGGEPLLRKDLLAVIDLAIEHGLHPCITTNGLLLNERWVHELGQRTLLWLNVSVDGATAPVNDLVRGDGTFNAVLEKLRLLRGKVPFSLAFTVMKHNASQAGMLADLAHEVGANSAVLRPLYPVGVAADHEELFPTFAQYQEALAMMGSSSNSDNLEVFDPTTRAEHQATVIDHLGCGAGTTTASISVDGTVSPCSFLGAGFSTRSIRERSFSELWREGDKFVELRQFAESEATDSFRGGCRARAQHFGGSAYAADPWVRESVAENRGRHPLKVLKSVAGMCGSGSANPPPSTGHGEAAKLVLSPLKP